MRSFEMDFQSSQLGFDTTDTCAFTKEGWVMRRIGGLTMVVLLALAGWLGAGRVALAQSQGKVPETRPAMLQSALPILNFLGNDEVCASWVEVQNVGSTFTRVAMMVWGEPGFCPPQAAGPLKVECSGLVKGGATWNFLGAQVPTGGKSGLLFSLTTKSLSDVGLDDEFGYDDLIADLLCETLFFGIVGDADDYRRFKLAYDQGLSFAGLPMSLAWGQPIAAEVLRRCADPDSPADISSKYEGVTGFYYGQFDPVYGSFSYYTPLLYAAASGLESVTYIQNVGLDCTTVEIWFQQQDNCLRPLICEIFTLSPGETYQYAASDCVGPGWIGSAWMRTSQPIAVVVDQIGRSLLMTYNGTPSQLRFSYDGEPEYTRGSTVAYGPLVYSEYQGWETGIQVQNLSAITAAKVKVYFYDRSGDIITTLVDWICPRGSQSFYLPMVTGLPGNWVGWVRVESQEWFTPGAMPVPATPIIAVAQLIKYANIQQTAANEGVAYNLLPEPKAFDWQLGSGNGGTESGQALIAIPSLLKDLDATGVTTELAIANLVSKPGFTDFVIYIYDANGLIDFVCQKLGAKQVEYIDLQTWGYLSPGFKGAAVISAVFWEHDVFSITGQFQRNLVGLGAVTVERIGTMLAMPDIPGDQASAALGQPIMDYAFEFEGPRMPVCPGLEDAPKVMECPSHLVVHSDQLDLAIGDGGTVTAKLATDKFPSGCKVTDVDVYLAVAHSDAGDLTATLTLANQDAVVTNGLFSGICDGQASVITTLDDDAVAPVGSTCPAVGGTYTTAPVGGLDAFDGLSAQGEWTLTVIDGAIGNSGALLNWTLSLRTEGVPQPQP